MTKKGKLVDDVEIVEHDVAPEVAPHNGSPNPPTEVVPEDPIPLPEEPVGEQPVAAPVWEGGDPGVAVPSADDQDDTYYHPEGELPPLDTDGDLIPDDVDDDDDNDGILDVDEV